MPRPLRLAALAALLAAAAAAQDAAPVPEADLPDFGDDSSVWAHDGVCDDPRFSGSGAALPPMSGSGLMRDAADCRAAWDAGTIAVADGPQIALPEASRLAFGDDTSKWAVDGECDDPRFEGPGMTATPLLDADRLRDATDCRTAYESGTVTLRAGAAAVAAPAPLVHGGVVLGDDASAFANDGECDDRRFTGQGMAGSLRWDESGHDATDCRAGLESGNLKLWDWDEARAAANCPLIDFGTDASDYAGDGECDDPRFEGPGTAQTMSTEDLMRDASDCRRLCTLGIVGLRDYRSY